MNYEQGVSQFMAIQRRIAELSEADKHLLKTIENVSTGRYSATADELIMLTSIFDNNATNAFGTIFRYGFLKGQRAEQERKRKAARK